MPDWRPVLRARLAALDLAPERQIEIVEELSLHLEARYGELLAGGRVTGRREFGGEARVWGRANG